MDLDRLISELHAERMRLDAAIAALERAAASTMKRRGRPPKWLVRVRTSQPAQPLGDETGRSVEIGEGN
jgi:chorismate mutase